MKKILKNGNPITSVPLCIVILLSSLMSCKEKTNATKPAENTDVVFEEQLYRPNFHFTPEKNWINDPNGMFYFNGYYHLYYQHYPDGNVWGPMHWGHAISTDLITWKEQPIALYPDELGYIFSGSAVVDLKNTSGFGSDGEIPIVAMYTSHNPKKAEEDEIDVETQSIAYSSDEGLTYTKYEGNPVIKNPGIRDFRDPKVSWDDIHKKWTMV
ncbi:MAG: glycoside hydrolase family 32 protein, partial [Pricia sp.]